MHVPSAILHAIGWFCHCVVRLAQSIQQLSAQSARAALPLSLREKTKHENRLIYKLLKIFCCCFLFSLETLKAVAVGGSASSQRASQQLRPRQGPHTHANTHTRTNTTYTQTNRQEDSRTGNLSPLAVT